LHCPDFELASFAYSVGHSNQSTNIRSRTFKRPIISLTLVILVTIDGTRPFSITLSGTVPGSSAPNATPYTQCMVTEHIACYMISMTSASEATNIVSKHVVATYEQLFTKALVILHASERHPGQCNLLNCL
jgi:hypothetical protein